MDQGCTACHSPHASDHKYQLKQSAPDLCLTCHQEWFDQKVRSASVVHGAVTAEGGCTGCHQPHSSRLPNLQRGTQPGICLGCHDKPLKGPDKTPITNMASLLANNPDHHGPIREGLCTACHSPHAGQHFRLLAEDYPPQFYAPFSTDTFKLCFKCHIQDLVLKPSGVGLTQFRDGDKNLHWVHVNREKGRTCRACHEVHASKRPLHIREAVPFGNSGWMLEINFQRTAEGGSCSPGCHKTRGYTRTGTLAPIVTGAPR
jgi:predicted CXXCH cytochrome family protein